MYACMHVCMITFLIAAAPMQSVKQVRATIYQDVGAESGFVDRHIQPGAEGMSWCRHLVLRVGDMHTQYINRLYACAGL